MTTDRIKEIQMATAYPKSHSVAQALLKVWNECEQEIKIPNAEDVKRWHQILIGRGEDAMQEDIKPVRSGDSR